MRGKDCYRKKKWAGGSEENSQKVGTREEFVPEDGRSDFLDPESR